MLRKVGTELSMNVSCMDLRFSSSTRSMESTSADSTVSIIFLELLKIPRTLASMKSTVCLSCKSMLWCAPGSESMA